MVLKATPVFFDGISSLRARSRFYVVPLDEAAPTPDAFSHT